MLILKILGVIIAFGIIYLVGYGVGYLGYNLFDRFRNTMKSIKR